MVRMLVMDRPPSRWIFVLSGPIYAQIRTPKSMISTEQADLLMIDDMGLKALPKQSGEYLFEIIMRCYENRSTMMTLNRPLEDWGKLIGDVPAARAILDRFLHHAEVIAITGKSYRLKDHAVKKHVCKAGKETVKCPPDQPLLSGLF